jgi:hypothetical protein
VADYLARHRPRRPRGVTEPAGDGWLTLAGADVRFRVPTVADLLGGTSSDHSGDTLTRDCVEPAALPRALARRVDRALSAIAPRLDDLVGGVCPACGLEVAMRFDPLAYTVAELRNAFAAIHWETHALASAYGWPEEAILALPRSRRRRYASIITGSAITGSAGAGSAGALTDVSADGWAAA